VRAPPASGSATQHADKCLDLTGNSSADFTVVELWTRNGGANQKWTVPA
jgi:hypothetical protein